MKLKPLQLEVLLPPKDPHIKDRSSISRITWILDLTESMLIPLGSIKNLSHHRPLRHPRHADQQHAAGAGAGDGCWL